MTPRSRLAIENVHRICRRQARGPARSRDHRHLSAAGAGRDQPGGRRPDAAEVGARTGATHHRRPFERGVASCAASTCPRGGIGDGRGRALRSRRTTSSRPRLPASASWRRAWRRARTRWRRSAAGDFDAVVVQAPDGGRQVYTLENADRPYRVLIEEIQEGALTLSVDGVVLYCNPAARHDAERAAGAPDRPVARPLRASRRSQRACRPASRRPPCCARPAASSC